LVTRLLTVSPISHCPCINACTLQVLQELVEQQQHQLQFLQLVLENSSPAVNKATHTVGSVLGHNSCNVAEAAGGASSGGRADAALVASQAAAPAVAATDAPDAKLPTAAAAAAAQEDNVQHDGSIKCIQWAQEELVAASSTE